MTRQEELVQAARKEYPEWKEAQCHFIDGAHYADSHPRWISVDEELPKIGWTMSDTVVVTDGNGGLRLAWYHQDEGWHFATGLPFEPTHWMPLPSIEHLKEK